MDSFLIFKSVAALLVISGMCFIAARYFKQYAPKISAKFESEIDILEQKYLSNKHKIVVVKYKNSKYVLLLGETSEQLLDKIKL